MQRRDLLVAAGAAATVGLAGCSSPTDSADPAHTVSVYLGDRDTSREATVTVRDGDGNSLFESDYSLSDSNEADEDATFPASTEPETIIVTVDGTRFERNWPGIEHPELPCEEPNHAGIEVWIESNQDSSPEVRLEVNCQSASVDS